MADQRIWINHRYSGAYFVASGPYTNFTSLCTESISTRGPLIRIPVSFASYAAFNEHLESCCRKRQDERLRGHDETIGERLKNDLAAMLPLPAVPYDACAKQATRVSSLSLVRYGNNDYSVPVAYGHREVLVKAYVDRVEINCGSDCIAKHERSYGKADFIFDPLHYLALIERKVNALDQAVPLADWSLPPSFTTLRHLLEARMGKAGKREYVQVLRLLETFALVDVDAAVVQAVQLGVIGFDAVKHVLLCRIEQKPPRLNLDIYPYLPRAQVNVTHAASYLTLLAGGTA